MCNCVICFRPCQSNTESAGMPRLETLVTRPDASNRLSHVTWVFRIMLRSSVSKHLRFGISTPCRNVSFASAIPSAFWLEHLSDFDRCCSRLTITCVIKVPREQTRPAAEVRHCSCSKSAARSWMTKHFISLVRFCDDEQDVCCMLILTIQFQ